MNQPRISAIAAIGKNSELGKNNHLIWCIPDDLKRLRKLTSGHTIIMGRKTYESIGRPLPDRHNIVITRQPTYNAPGCTVVKSVVDALKAVAAEETEVFIFGGATIYELALPLVSRLYLTIIDAEDAEADVFFPDYTQFNNELISENHQTDSLTYSYKILEKG